MSEEQQPKRPIITVSGMRPTGRLHLGHYFGAISNWLKLQEEGAECYFFVADWHALTTGYANTKDMSQYRLEMVADWLACGLDENKATIFYQSYVPQHAELNVLLGMITPTPWLERTPSYKEMKTQLADRDLSAIGFLNYPVLMASDILLYGATHVPVGEDQLPHLELAREIARRFNHFYGKRHRVLREPEALLTTNESSVRLLGVDGRKMSKSYDNAIYLSDTAKVVEKKIKTAMTDPARITVDAKGNPDNCPMYQYQHLFHDQEKLDYIASQCRGGCWGCLECKKMLLEPLQKTLEPIREKRAELLAKPDYLKQIVDEGSRKAREKAEENMARIRAAVGLA